MITGRLKSSVVAGVASAVLWVGVPEDVSACSCVGSAMGQAGAVSSMVGTGSAAIVTALDLGFRGTITAVEVGSGSVGRALETSITEMGKHLGTQILAQAATQQGIEQRLNATMPSRHATNECEYLDRSTDSTIADRVLGAQQTALSNAVINYNEVKNSYPEGINADVAFSAQTGKMLRERPEIKTSPLKLVAGPEEVGAMTEEEITDASRALNLALNPSPPSRPQNPSTPAELQLGVEADLHNMRMMIPQGISHDILSYEAPILDLGEDSWFGSMLERMSEEDYNKFVGEDRNVSKSDLIKHMATHRMKDPVTTAMTAVKEPQGLQKDLAMVKADQLVMDYELWLQDRYQALLLSQLVASQVRQERKGVFGE